MCVRAHNFLKNGGIYDFVTIFVKENNIVKLWLSL